MLQFTMLLIVAMNDVADKNSTWVTGLTVVKLLNGCNLIVVIGNLGFVDETVAEHSAATALHNNDDDDDHKANDEDNNNNNNNDSG